MKILFHIGRYIQMIFRMFYRPDNWRMYWQELLRQINEIGVTSIPIVILICGFIGAVTAVQMSYQLVALDVIEVYYVSYIVRDSLLLELAPTFACLVLAGKVGSNLATELGTMRINDQIDALEIMGVHSSSFLVLPKIIAAVLAVPALVVIGAAMGMAGGYLAGEISGLTDWFSYQKGLKYAITEYYFGIMFVKALVFSFIFSSIACYQGFYVKGGALEIGKNSTRAVVISSIMILLADLVVVVAMTQ